MIGTLKKELNSSNMQDFLENDHDTDVISQGDLYRICEGKLCGVGRFLCWLLKRPTWKHREAMSLLLGSMAAFLIGPNQSTSSRGAAAALPCVWPKRDVSGYFGDFRKPGHNSSWMVSFNEIWGFIIYYDQSQSPAFWTKSVGKETSTGNSFRRSNESSTFDKYVICNDLKEQYTIVRFISG